MGNTNSSSDSHLHSRRHSNKGKRNVCVDNYCKGKRNVSVYNYCNRGGWDFASKSWTDESESWDVVFDGDVCQWENVAVECGLNQYPVRCNSESEPCDRDYVCHGYMAVTYQRRKRILSVSRYGWKPFSIPVKRSSQMSMLLASTCGRHLHIVAVSRSMAVLEIMIGERGHAFPIMDMSQRKIKAVYSPTFQLTLIEGALSPDLTCTGLLLYCQAEHSRFFTYDLFLISNETGEALSRTVLSPGDVQPHFAFHPAYGSSHIAVTQYRKEDAGKLVILNLADERVVTTSSPYLSLIMGIHQLFAKFSLDGRFLFLQKLSDDRLGVTSFCDTYIFNLSEDTFHLVKYVSSQIPDVFSACRIWFRPEFSCCGRYMRMISYSKQVSVLVYRLPVCLDLMAQCRAVIMGRLVSDEQVEELPIPSRLKKFLLFHPVYDL